MDFYYAMTNYHVLCCLIHKLVINKNKGTLYLSSFLQYNQPNIVNNIKESKIFEEVKFYDELEFKKTEKIMNKDEISNEIKRINNLVEKNIGKKIKDADNIYLCSDFYSIGVYVNNNNIKYSYFEDGCGILSRYYMPFKILEKENPNRALIVKKQGAFGNNKNVINRFGSLKEQEEGYSNPKDIDFSVKDLLKKISKNDINKLLNIFEVKKINIKNNNAILFLTMHYNELMSIENQKKIYSTILDYFTEEKDKLIIKPHPADTIFDYNKAFKKSTTLNRFMPSELFPYCIEGKFKSGLTCYSTAIYGLKNMLKQIVAFDTKIDKTYEQMAQYYAIEEYLKKIKTEKIVNINLKNINEMQLKMLLEKYFKDYKKHYTLNEINSSNNIYIVDKITDDLKDSKVISLEEDIYSKNIIYINKKNKEENSFISLYNLEKIELNISKKLKYSNSEIIIKYLDEEGQRIEFYNIIKEKNRIIKKQEKIYEKKIESIKNELEEQRKNLNNIYNSKSWRFLEKLRKIKRVFR